MNRCLILQRIGASLAVVTAFAVDWWLCDRFLTSPVGFFVYFPPALLLAWWSLIAVWYAFSRDHPGFIAFILILIGAVGFSFLGAPWTSGSVERFLYHRDPIGVADDVATGPCRTREVVVLPNGRGSVADLRETYCSGNWDGDLMYFVFVHPATEINTRQNLAFRYSADTLPDVGPPGVRWLDARTLRVVADRDVMDVSERRSSIGDISIQYVVDYEASE